MGTTDSDSQRLDEDRTTAEHISELEKALATSRDEVEALRSGLRLAELERDVARGLAATNQEHLSECVAERDEARAELARLKPSGRVAEDMAWVRAAVESRVIQHWMEQPDYDRSISEAERRVRAAFERLATKAQGYEAAIWDNAAKDRAFTTYVEMYGVQHGDVPETETSCPEDDTCECEHILALNAAFGPHRPGVALLEELQTLRGVQAHAQADAKFIHEAIGWAGEWPRSLPAPSRAVVALREQHRKEVAQAWNDGLEEAARVLDVVFDQPTMADEVRAKKSVTVAP